MIPRSRRSLGSFDKEGNTSTKADRSHAGGVLHAKEGLGWGGGAHREWCSVGGTRRWGTVVSVCLVPEVYLYRCGE